MTEEITELDSATVSQIAAGEVVERPASVVKELVENSLDAEASRIDVEVEGGGARFMKVVDDGVGMDETAVRTAVRQHTTSKIRTIDDLETGLSTLGFRGEALYTIGAVAKMTVTTRPRDGSDVGTELRVVGGEIEDVAPAGRGPGTTVTVEDLFFNTPARKKYLKSESTEFARINRVVTRYALANPDVAVSLSHDGSTVFSTAGRGDLQEAILAVYGREVAESMIAVDVDPDADPDGPVDRIAGYVSDPETTRSTREYVSTFVNGRYVRAGLLREAVVDAYGNQLAPDRFPFAVLFLDVPPESVDVNVHPRKLEVRFGDEAGVGEAVTGAVRDALLSSGLIRTSAPRGQSAPEDATIAPEPDTPDEATDTEPGTTVEREQTDSESGAATDEPPTDPEAQVRAEDTLEPSAETGTESSSADVGDELTPTGSDSVEPAVDPPVEPTDDDRGSAEPVPKGSEAETAPVRSDGVEDQEPPQGPPKFAGPDEQSGLTGSRPETEFETLPPLQVLGQIEDTYIVAESPDGLVLIDQHAADERVHYERLVAELDDRSDSQRLVEPVTLEVTPQEASAFSAVRSALEELGFAVSREGESVTVEAVPAVFSETLSPELVREVLADFLGDEAQRDLVASAADALLADMACYPAITGGTSLRDGEVLELLRALDDCENPYACPHGRPVVIEISAAELDARFERDYPGHATRRPEE